MSLISVDAQGNQANGAHYLVYLPGYEWISPSDGCQFLTEDGITWHWYNEIFRAIDDDGEPYTWWAHLCGPLPVNTLWTPEYRERSERLHRISASDARHLRRERIARTGPGPRVDPMDVFSDDGWLCHLCGEGIDAAFRHPDPLSASLDHVLPLAAGGAHVRDNMRASHLRCNLRKGARIFAEPEDWNL